MPSASFFTDFAVKWEEKIRICFQVAIKEREEKIRICFQVDIREREEKIRMCPSRYEGTKRKPQ